MASVLCRVCLTSVERKHSTALFTGQNWSHRLSELLRVPVREDDSFPDYICRSCRRTVESVESKLRYLKERIMDSYKRFSNDIYGHITEDYVLKQAESIQAYPISPDFGDPGACANRLYQAVFPPPQKMAWERG